MLVTSPWSTVTMCHNLIVTKPVIAGIKVIKTKKLIPTALKQGETWHRIQIGLSISLSTMYKSADFLIKEFCILLHWFKRIQLILRIMRKSILWSPFCRTWRPKVRQLNSSLSPIIHILSLLGNNLRSDNCLKYHLTFIPHWVGPALYHFYELYMYAAFPIQFPQFLWIYPTNARSIFLIYICR